MSQRPLIVITGPTAVGKTTVASHVALALNGEVISADSRQVYRGMDIGTGKDLAEYEVSGQSIPYHLIDICEPGEIYNLRLFQDDFAEAYTDITDRSKRAILCGGTGLYIQAVLEQYQMTAIPDNAELRAELSAQTTEELTAKLSKYSFPDGYISDSSTRKRLIRAIEMGEYLLSNPEKQSNYPTFDYVIFGLTLDRELRRQRITERLKKRLENGLVEEVNSLIKNGISVDQLRLYGLEYKYVTDHIEGMISADELFEKLNVAIHQFAKRQMTWFRKMEREGHEIHWIDATIPLSDKVRTIVDKCCG